MKKLTKISMALIFSLVITGCSSVDKKELSPREVAMMEVEEDKRVLFGKDDYLSGYNTRMYRFDIGLDRYVTSPVLKTYDYYTPDFVQDRVKNFFSNLGEVGTFANLLLQLRVKDSLETLGRFAFNSTIGIFGTFDVATDMGLDKHSESFSETLAYYNVGAGVPLVIPFLGPTNIRTAVGAGINGYGTAQVEPYKFADINTSETPYTVTSAFQLRKNLGLFYGDTDYVFEYEYLKYLNKKYQDLKYQQAKNSDKI